MRFLFSFAGLMIGIFATASCSGDLTTNPAEGEASTSLATSGGSNRAQAGKPIRIDLDDPAFEAEQAAFLSSACGVPLFVDLDGFILIIQPSPNPRARRQLIEINVFHIEQTVSNAEGETVRLLDVGPDLYYLEDGVLHVAITGRSLTGSGVIGRVVINIETGEVVFQAGREVGDYVKGICETLG